LIKYLYNDKSEKKVNISIHSSSKKLKKPCDNDFTYLNKASKVDLCFKAHCEERPEILYFDTSVFLLIY
jgi:hypothetical protein